MEEEIVKPTYEELENICKTAIKQRDELNIQLNKVLHIVNILPFFFKVIENKEVFSTEFVNASIKEIENILSPNNKTDKD